MVERSVYIAVFFLLFLAGGAVAGDVNNRVVAEVFFSEDTDDTEYQKYLTGYDRLFSHKQYAGLRIGRRNYHEDFSIDEKGIAFDEKDFNELKFLGRKNIGDSFYTEASISFLSGEDWDPVIYAINAVYKPDSHWRIESYVERELVDSIDAIEAENSFLVGGVVVDYNFLEEYTLVAGTSRQRFKDKNNRDAWLAQFMYSPKWFEGFTFKLEAKESKADFNPPEYFAPDTHKQYFAILRYMTALDSKRLWWLRLEGGPGKQYINDIKEDAMKYRIDIEGPITQSFNMDMYYGCTSDGGEEDYEYCYGGAALQYYW